MKIGTVDVDGLGVVVANSASVGDMDTDVPTAAHASAVVAVGDFLSIIPASEFNASGGFYYVVEIQPDSVGGTLVAGVTTAPTAVTGDVRGTYDPASACNGALAFQLLFALPNPTDRGVAQYAG